MIYKFIYLNKEHLIKLEKKEDTYKVAVNDSPAYDIIDVTREQNIISFKINDKLYNIHFAQEKDRTYLSFNGDYFIFDLEKAGTVSTKRSVLQKGNSVSSPMPGLLVKIPVTVGDKITAGTTLAIVEAMKMQNELRAPSDGVVKKVNFKEGEQVDALQPIVELDIE